MCSLFLPDQAIMACSSSIGSVQHFAGSLANIAADLFAEGEEEQVVKMYDAAHNLLRDPSNGSCKLVVQLLECGSERLLASSGRSNDGAMTMMEDDVDLYLEDECDVGPRLLRTPVRLDFTCILDNHAAFIESVLMLNRGIALHSKSHIAEAKEHYDFVIAAAHHFLQLESCPGNRLLEMAMRAHNNLGKLYYIEGDERLALYHIQAALVVAERLCHFTRSYQLEHSTVLSNWCRVNWMHGDHSDTLLRAVREVLRIRLRNLPWSHSDVAAAHYNVAVALYSRHQSKQAIPHLIDYLQIAAAQSKAGKNELDPIPALTFLLLIQNEDNDDHVCQELVRGLRTLQDKRQDQGPNTTEVASVLNFIGTLLFHKHDLDNALLFFQEELRLEERLSEGRADISVSVTCNNIGRILQELGKLQDAMYYYQRALKAEYGDTSKLRHTKIASKATQSSPAPATHDSPISPSTANLYSTVWYNLGLIHDKLGSFGDATCAFQMSLELRRTMLGQDHPDIACLLYNIGVLQMEQQLLQEASDSFRDALRIRRVGVTGQLNDRHVVKTLEKLVSLQKAKGNIAGALTSSQDILHVQEVSTDYDATVRAKEVGATLRAIAELHHAHGDLATATTHAVQSVQVLRSVLIPRNHNIDSTDAIAMARACTDYADHVEQLVSSHLLVGSLYHEQSEPILAATVFAEAQDLLKTIVTVPHASLVALCEVTTMLACLHCAPEA